MEPLLPARHFRFLPIRRADSDKDSVGRIVHSVTCIVPVPPAPATRTCCVPPEDPTTSRFTCPSGHVQRGDPESLLRSLHHVTIRLLSGIDGIAQFLRLTLHRLFPALDRVHRLI